MLFRHVALKGTLSPYRKFRIMKINYDKFSTQHEKLWSNKPDECFIFAQSCSNINCITFHMEFVCFQYNIWSTIIIQNAGIVCVLNPTETRLTHIRPKVSNSVFLFWYKDSCFGEEKNVHSIRENRIFFLTINNGRDTPTIYMFSLAVSYSVYCVY